MRRQTALAGGASAGSSRAFRLDPFALPIRYTAALGDGRFGRSSIHLDRYQATLSPSATGGVQRMLTLPVSAYAGVAVRIVASEDGTIRALVELMHDDPDLSLPLVVADEPEDVAADWQAWGRALNLPLLLIASNGEIVRAADRLGGLTVAAAKPRRRHSYFAARRPRFLARRKAGRKGPAEVVAGREIIARN
ncbi:MAG: DUF6101 family protein [Bauldia sp.]